MRKITIATDEYLDMLDKYIVGVTALAISKLNFLKAQNDHFIKTNYIFFGNI